MYIIHNFSIHIFIVSESQKKKKKLSKTNLVWSVNLLPVLNSADSILIFIIRFLSPLCVGLILR